MGWTLPRTWTTLELVTAAIMNAHVRDNLRYLKGLDGAISLDAALSSPTLTTPAINGTVTTTGLTLPTHTSGTITINTTNGILRDVTDNALQLFGSTGVNTGASILMAGKDHAFASAVYLITPNAANDSYYNRVILTGDTDIASFNIYYSTFAIYPDGTNARLTVTDTSIVMATDVGLSSQAKIQVSTTTTGHWYGFYAYDVDGAAYAEVARVQNADDPIFCFGGSQQIQMTNSGVLYLSDDTELRFGGSSVARFCWETADANANALVLALPDGGATDVPVFAIGDQSINNADLGWFDGETIPRIAMVAADNGGYFAFGVDNSDILDIIATTGPVVEVDETKFSHKLQVVINGSTYYIMLCAT